METSLWVTLLTDIVAVAIGVFAGFKMASRENNRKAAEAQSQADIILKNAEMQAESIKKDRILEAKEKYLKLKTEFEEETNRKRQILTQNEGKLRQREQEINQMQQEFRALDVL